MRGGSCKCGGSAISAGKMPLSALCWPSQQNFRNAACCSYDIMNNPMIFMIALAIHALNRSVFLLSGTGCCEALHALPELRE